MHTEEADTANVFKISLILRSMASTLGTSDQLLGTPTVLVTPLKALRKAAHGFVDNKSMARPENYFLVLVNLV